MIGIDIEKIDRFENWTEEGLKRIFTKKEIEYASQFENRLEHFCGFFCVKEAFVKALDDDTLNYSGIEILHTESGKPYINITPYSVHCQHAISHIWNILPIAQLLCSIFGNIVH